MTRSHPRTSAEGSAGSRVGAVIFNPDLHAILVFCAIGLLATVNAVLWFPDFGGMVAQLAQFP